MPTRYNVITAFIESEFRAAAAMAQRALSAIKNGKPSEARQHLMKARLCFMAALLHLRPGQEHDKVASADADRLDDALREIERLLEHVSCSTGTAEPRNVEGRGTNRR